MSEVDPKFMDSPIPHPRVGDTTPMVLVVVGTDGHAFDRLMSWLERWYAERPSSVRLVVQHGSSRAPRLPGAVRFLNHDQLQRAMTEAKLVVSHGGPATITEARQAGHLPIVVPRDPDHGEHVDDHQQLFTRRLAAAKMVKMCLSEAALVTELDAGLADPSAYRLSHDEGAALARAAAVTRVGRIVEELVAAQSRGGAGR